MLNVHLVFEQAIIFSKEVFAPPSETYGSITPLCFVFLDGDGDDDDGGGFNENEKRTKRWSSKETVEEKRYVWGH